MSLALARKYRPRRFADVAVQSHVANTLKGAIARGRVAHGYLLCGPRGTGKTTLARVLAMALNCDRRADEARRGREAAAGTAAAGETPGPDAGEPCGECESCQRIWAGSASLDVVEIDAASNRGVDDARDLRERAMYAPTGEDRHKVYIVDEAHMLTREAWNALLKILEEPPPRVVFVFATTEPQKIAQAAAPVLSRLQRFDLKRIGPADVRARLAAVLTAERVGFEPDALGMLARAADGSMRDALSLTDQVLSLGAEEVTTQRVRDALGLVQEDEYLALLDLIAERRARDVFAAVGRLTEAGVDFGLLLAGLGDALRSQLAIVLGGALPDVSEHFRAALEVRKTNFAASDLLRMLAALVEIEPHFRRSGQQQLLLETLLVRFALLDRTLEIEEMLRGLGGAPTSGGGGVRRESADRAPGPPAPTRPKLFTESARVAEAIPGLGQHVAGDAGRSTTPVPPRRTPARPATDAAPRARDPGPAKERVLADQPIARKPKQPLDLNRLAERWDDVVEAVRAAGRGMVASALAESTPSAVTANGLVTIGVGSDALAEALQNGSEAVLAALRGVFDGVERITVNTVSDGLPAARRLTAADVVANRVAMLRKRDPLLDAAIDALDLRLIE